MSVRRLYTKLRTVLEDNGFKVDDAVTIQHGIQFPAYSLGRECLIRVYESKKGVRIDLSQVKQEALALQISKILEEAGLSAGRLLSIAPKKTKGVPQSTDAKDPKDLIGVDESGKGDYFGPLVIASVHVNPGIEEKLIKLGVQDSKRLSDPQIQEMAAKIRDITAHSIIIMSNKSYNEVYESMPNLNHILSWAHCKVIESTYKKTTCENALSDDFGSPDLIRKTLKSKGIPVKLYSRPRAESNIAVAAASILARDKLVEGFEELKAQFNRTFPKGASTSTISVAKELVEEYGEGILPYVSKLHFKTTEQVLDAV